MGQNAVGPVQPDRLVVGLPSDEMTARHLLRGVNQVALADDVVRLNTASVWWPVSSRATRCGMPAHMVYLACALSAAMSAALRTVITPIWLDR